MALKCNNLLAPGLNKDKYSCSETKGHLIENI